MRAINFNAGPAGLPLPALERARDELLDYGGSGMSIMEHSHRGKEFEAVQAEAISLLTELLGLPASHQVLLLQGGASLQFAMVPMNFLPLGASADYVITGTWSEKALSEAKMVGQPRVACTTIIADKRSDFIWRKFDAGRFGLIYGGAQKNVGPSGLVVVIARKDLLAKGRKDLPKILRYETFAENNSMYNTPPTFAIYLMRNVLAWVKQVGGLGPIESWNREKARLLYGALDAMSGFYRAPVERESRSLMNVVFRLSSEALEEKFVAEAKKQGMVGLKGHRSAGGIRVSTYNAVTVENVKTLVSFLERFAKANG